jgi:hypothetical protein
MKNLQMGKREVRDVNRFTWSLLLQLIEKRNVAATVVVAAPTVVVSTVVADVN